MAMTLKHPQKRLGPKSLLACVLAINIIVILAVDMYTPALPGMMRQFGVSISFLNLTLFIFFFVSAFVTFIAGPISDRTGRKPLLVGASALFAISSVGCALSPSVGILVLFRIGEAIGFGAIATLSTAIVADAYDDASRKLGMTALQSMIIIGPAVAPFLGTGILTFTTWRGIFVALAIGGTICTLLACLITEPMQEEDRLNGTMGSAIKQMIRNAGHLLKSKPFTSFTFIMSIIGVPYLAFVAVASYILLDDFGMSYLGFSVIYAVICLVSVISPYIYLAMSRRLSVHQILWICFGFVAVAFAIMLLLGVHSAVALLVAMVIYAIAEGVIRPMAFVVLLDQPAEYVGSASAFSNFSYTVFSALATVFATLSFWPNLVFGIAIIMIISLGISILLYFWGMRGVHFADDR